MSTDSTSFETTFWRRQEEGLLIHEYCSINPLRLLRSLNQVRKGEYSRPIGMDDASNEEADADNYVRFIPPYSSSPTAGWIWSIVFLLLEYSPLVILLTTFFLFSAAEYSDKVQPLSAYLPAIDLVPIGVGIIALLAWWGILLWLVTSIIKAGFYKPFSSDAITDIRQIMKAFIVYGGGLALFSLTLFSLFLVLTGNTSENVIFSSGYLFTLYVGGPLVYDGFRRTETLFSNLDIAGIITTSNEEGHSTLTNSNRKNSHSEETEGEAELLVSYGKYLNYLRAALESTWLFHIPMAMVASGIFVFLWVVIWWYAWGPFNLSWSLTFLVAVVGDWVIGIVAIQFVILIKFLNDLYEGNSEAENLEIRYDPSHADNAGGLRDLGRFITRVNSLMILGGLYLSYRLYVQGLRDPVMATGLVSNPETAGFIWIISYVLPIITFGIIVLGWIYFSFWTIHRTMLEKKHEKLEQIRTQHGVPIDYQRWQIYQKAPVWPINDRLIMTMVSLDIVSLVVALPAIL